MRIINGEMIIVVVARNHIANTSFLFHFLRTMTRRARPSASCSFKPFPARLKTRKGALVGRESRQWQHVRDGGIIDGEVHEMGVSSSQGTGTDSVCEAVAFGVKSSVLGGVVERQR